jgi:MFS family permease
MVAGRLVADPMVRRFGSVAAVRVGAAVGTVGLLLAVLAPDAAIGIAGFAVLGLGLCVVVPESFSAAGRHDPTGSGLAVSRVNLFNYIGFLIGAPLVGGVEVVANWRVGFAVPLVLVAGIVPLAWVFRPRPVPSGGTGEQLGAAVALADAGAAGHPVGEDGEGAAQGAERERGRQVDDR